MADEWYFKLIGSEYGPVSREALMEMVQSGQLGPDDEVRLGAEGSWIAVRVVIALLEGCGTSDVLQDLSDLNFTFVSEQDLARPAPSRPAPAAVETVSAPQWYCETFGMEMGPFSQDEVLEMARGGQLSATDRIRMGEDGSWAAADTYSWLAAVLPRPSAKPVASKPLRQRRAVSPAAAAQSTTPAVEPGVDALFDPPTSEAIPKTLGGDPSPASPAAAEVAPPAPSPVSATVEPVGLPTSLPANAIEPARPSWGGTVAARPSPSRPSKSREPWGPQIRERLAAVHPAAYGVLAVALLVFGVPYLMELGGRSAADDYVRLHQYYQEFEQLRDRKADAGAWDAFSARVKADLEPLVAELTPRVTARTPGPQHIMLAARDGLLPMLQDAREKPSRSEMHFANYMKMATLYLGADLPAPPPVPAEFAADTADNSRGPQWGR